MKNIFWIIFFTVIFSAFSFLYAHNKGYCETTVEGALDAARNVRSQVDGKEKLNSRLNVPATSDTIQMETFGTHEKFDATIMCPGAGPIISVQMLPEDSLAGSGEVNLIGSYDLNQDGNFDQTVQARHVGGMCGDGFIANCSPHGSWDDCKFYKWYFHEGEILALDYDPEFSDNENQRPISLADLHGCFCFNRSCNNAIRGRKSQVLSYFASGIMDVMRRVNKEVVITKVDENPAMMTLEYIGASISDCHTNKDIEYQPSSVQELTNLSSNLDFNEELAVSSAPADSAFGVLSSAHSNTAGGESYTTYQCEIESKVGHRLEVKTRDPKISCEKVRTDPEKPVFDIVNPDTTDGHWYHPHGKSKFVLAHNEMMRVSIDPSYCEPLNFMWTTVEVKCGDTWVTIRQVDGYYLNVSNSCSGGSFDSIDVTPRQYLNLVMNRFPDVKWWPEYKYECDGAGDEKCLSADDLCRCVITDDIFTCYSSGMGPGDDSMIINNDSGRGYNKILFQGCEEIKDPENGCKIYENDPDCTLVSEITDGIPTMSGGVLTNAESMGSCRLIEGDARSITVCEPWWKKVRQYRCLSSLNFNYENVKARTKYVGQHIDYNNGDWGNQGDLRFSSDGSSFTEVFDPKLQFDTNIDVEELSCLVSYESENTDLMIDGLETTSFNSTRTIYESRVCKEQNGAYICPHGEGETVESPCSKFDDKSFATAIAGLTTLRNAPTDMICSSGEKQGMCDPEDLGKPAKRIVCYTNPTYDADADLYNGEVKDCVPNTWWRKTPLQDQAHRIYATEDYHCRAEYPGLSEDEGEEDTDYFNNDLGAMSPLSAWFDPAVNWAKPLIIEHLQNDPEFIPDPGPECPCVGSSSKTTSTSDGNGGTFDCEWSVETSVENINRLDKLSLNVENTNPFGNVELYFSRTGKWGGTHYGACTLGSGICVPGQICTLDNTFFSTASECEEVCKEPIVETRYECSTLQGTSFDSLSECNNVCSGYSCDESKKDIEYQIPFAYMPINSFGSGNSFWVGNVIPDSAKITKIIYTRARSSDADKAYIKINDQVLGPWGLGSHDVDIDIKSYLVPGKNYLYAKAFDSLQTLVVNIQVKLAPSDSLCTMSEWIDKYVYISISSGRGGCQSKTKTFDMPEFKTVRLARYGLNDDGWVKINDSPVYGHGGGNPYSCGHNNGFGATWKGLYVSMDDYIKETGNVFSCSAYRGGYANSCSIHLQYKTGTPNQVGTCSETSYIAGYIEKCDDASQCTGVETNYGEVYTDNDDCLTFCKEYSCSISPDKYSIDDISACEEECTESISCNAQSEDYRFNTTIKNSGNNDYSEELDLIEPETRHIASDPYEHEDLILQQCIDRYFKNYVNFDDASTDLHFEHKLADFLIYAAASIKNGELPIDPITGDYPGRLPKIPPVYTATYGGSAE
jgi:hypothetical protein